MTKKACPQLTRRHKIAFHERLLVHFGLATVSRDRKTFTFFANIALQFPEDTCERILMRNLFHLTWLAALASVILIASPSTRIFAQEEGEGDEIDASTPDDGSSNPTGVAGVFNGNITTGGSYDLALPPKSGHDIMVVLRLKEEQNHEKKSIQ